SRSSSWQPPQPGMREQQVEREQERREHRERHEQLLVGDPLLAYALDLVQLVADRLEAAIERSVVGGAEELAPRQRRDAAQRGRVDGRAAEPAAALLPDEDRVDLHAHR